LRLRLNNKQETQTGPENRGHFFGLLPVLDARRRVSSSCSTKTCVLKSLRFRRDASRCASLAHFYCAFGMAFLRGCYHQILGPLLHLPKFAAIADTPMPRSTSTRILSGKPPRAMWSAAVLLGLYRIRLLPGTDCRLPKTAYNLSALSATGRRRIWFGHLTVSLETNGGSIPWRSFAWGHDHPN